MNKDVCSWCGSDKDYDGVGNFVRCPDCDMQTSRISKADYDHKVNHYSKSHREVIDIMSAKINSALISHERAVPFLLQEALESAKQLEDKT